MNLCNTLWTRVTPLLLSLLVACVAGCGSRDPAPRTFTEVELTPAPAPASTAPATSPLAWTSPEGWSESPGAGMRLVSFSIGEGEQTAGCNLIVLRGAAGGAEANLSRWMQQLGLPTMAPADLQAFTAGLERVKTEGGFEAVLVDFGDLQGESDEQTPSMLAALIALPGQTAFFKMNGPRSVLQAQKSTFRALCASLRTSS